jgi:CDP-diacylglycerol---serine O-phosphatidyltransferase
MLLKILLPNFITSLNMLSGLGSIYCGVNGRPILAVLLIFLGMIMDYFDGKVARLTGTTSKFGMYLDSVTDVVSFGIAPIILVFVMSPSSSKMIIAFLLGVYAVCGVFRLARFTRNFHSRQEGIFTGMPIPAAAGTLMSFMLLYLSSQVPFPFFWVGSILLINSVLMISRISYCHFSKILDNFSGQIKIVTLALILVGIVLGYFPIILFVLFLLYAVFGIVWQPKLKHAA